nr:MAG TPA: hypothetical protein [Caudoviricetes sp.]
MVSIALPTRFLNLKLSYPIIFILSKVLVYQPFRL